MRKIFVWAAACVIFLSGLVSCGNHGTALDKTAPTIPTGLIANAISSSQIDLLWDIATDDVGVAGYNVYRNGVFVKSVTTTSASDTVLAPSTTYCYTVSAYDAANNESGQSGQACSTTQAAVPPAPTGVAATAGNGTVTISWNAVTGATAYNIYWSMTNGVTKLIGTKIGGVTNPYTHTGLTNGTMFYYVVTSVNAGGESADSSQVSATPQVPVPSVPTGVAATAGNGTVTINWTWNAAEHPVYNIYWSMTSGVTKATGTKIYGVLRPFTYVLAPYTLTGPANGTAYYFVMTAENAGGESAESSEVSAAPQAYTTGINFKIPDSGQATVYAAGDDGSYSINTPSYTDNGNGTITDNVTGLVWQKQDLGSTSGADWNSAVAYCSSLSLAGSGWRLPTVFELMTIVDYGRHQPVINTTYFAVNIRQSMSQSSNYWTSTVLARPLNWPNAFIVDFYDFGGAGNMDEAGPGFARCVR